ncbi:MAG TPA: hypothetical protein VFN19_05800, partial [Candidatus Nanopelagicales bacterium]|nr:hypothetical protein [Candidatus Nanopelagicales bacterium]
AGSVPAGDRRRRFRDRDDPTLLEQLLGLLDGLADEATAGRLLALAEAAAQALAVPGWRVLQVRPEGAAVVGASPERADAPLPEANELWRTVRSGGRVQVSADEVVLTAGGASGPQAGWVMELSGWAPAAEPARHLAEVRAALALALTDRGC